MHNGSLQRIGGPPSWIFEIKIFHSHTPQRHVMRYEIGHNVADISQNFPGMRFPSEI